MEKGEIYEGVVEKSVFPAKGMVTVEDRKVAVKGAIPGQKIRFSISKLKGGRIEGNLLQVMENSPLETAEDRCPHFGVCGGCVYQTLPYEEQMCQKEKQVTDLLEPVLGQVPMESILGSPRVHGYRNKMEYSFGDEVKGGRLSLGLHKKGSFYDIVTVNGCRIADRDFARIVESSREYFEERGIPFYHKMRHTGYLRHLLVRKAAKTGEILVSLVTSSQVSCIFSAQLTEGQAVSAGDRRLLAEAGQEEYGAGTGESVTAYTKGGAKNRSEEDSKNKMENAPADSLENSLERELLAGWKERLLALKLEGHFAGILHTVNDSLADVIQNDGTEILYGQDYFYEELLGLQFRISPFSFFQTNSLGAEVLYEKAREYVGSTAGKVIFDLYSGTGTIAQILAPVAEQVVGVEIVEEAVEAARTNAARNGLANCRFVAGDVLKVLDELPEKPDLIVLDPPRDGVHPKALPKIISYGVDRIVYISCKPTSLARDLAAFAAGGYQAEKVCCVDMFPMTAGIETVCLLSKIDERQQLEISLDRDELDWTDGNKEATYQEIQE